jgi:RNA polymerase sigma-B factor
MTDTARHTDAQSFDLGRERTRLLDAMAESRALRTVPTQRRALRLRFGDMPAESSVDLDLWRLHVRYHQRQLPSDGELLLQHYTPHARLMARRFFRDREPLDDLVQIASEALLLALERFDPGRAMPFLGFANPTIVGTIKRYYRDAGWVIRVPRQVHTLSKPVREAQEALAQDFGRLPSTAEIADFLSIDESDVRDALVAGTARATESLDAGYGDDVDRGAALGSVDSGMARVELRESLRQTVARLSPDDQHLIDLYFGQELRQTDIAERLGCSQMQVSRSLRRVLRQLRAFMPEGEE